MAASTTGPGRSGWHRALAYAITGTRLDDPEVGDLDHSADGAGDRSRPDLPALAALITERAGGPDRLREQIDARRLSGGPWPYPLPDDLRQGLGAAQLLAALTELRGILGVDRLASRPVIADRALNADERRLLGDVPPHHGG